MLFSFTLLIITYLGLYAVVHPKRLYEKYKDDPLNLWVYYSIAAFVVNTILVLFCAISCNVSGDVSWYTYMDIATVLFGISTAMAIISIAVAAVKYDPKKGKK